MEGVTRTHSALAALLGFALLAPQNPSTPQQTFNAQQVPDAQSAHALEDIELGTPFRVAEIKGRILSARRQPLEQATFMLVHPPYGSLAIPTDSTGSFKLDEPRAPMAFAFNPYFRGLKGAWKIGAGTYKFTASKEGFHSTVGAVIVSPDAPTDSVIEVLLQPGPDADDRTLEQRAADWDGLRLPSCAPGVNRNPKRGKYPGALVDIPVSLGLCVARTPEITGAKKASYRFMLEVDASLGRDRTNCLLGLFSGPLQRRDFNCLDSDPLLKADWAVWSRDQVVARGSSALEDHGSWGENSLAKILGYFGGEAGKKYAIEVKFLKDGSAINAANPHLILQRTN
jgi:hypothetical protein